MLTQVNNFGLLVVHDTKHFEVWLLCPCLVSAPPLFSVWLSKRNSVLQSEKYHNNILPA